MEAGHATPPLAEVAWRSVARGKTVAELLGMLGHARHTSWRCVAPLPYTHQNTSTTPAQRAMDIEDYIQRELEEEEYRHSHTGKNHPLFDPLCDTFTYKPYMYVTRDGCHTFKQKLEAREKLTEFEYIEAMLALINDQAAYDPEDRPYISKHMEQVSKDARGRHWPNVRKWSQGIWDSIERKDYTWEDTQLIQNERFMICIAPPNQRQQGRNISSAPYTTGTHHPDETVGGHSVGCLIAGAGASTVPTMMDTCIIAPTVTPSARNATTAYHTVIGR